MKTSLDEMNSALNTEEEKITEHDNIALENIQSETYRKKTGKIETKQR